MGKFKISIVIPVYNVEKYISRCLESILKQTYDNLEIVCINDGSTDNSLKILQEYEKKDTRVKVFSKENEGVSAARNLGIEKASGEYITFVDGDDFIEPDMIEGMLYVLNENDADIVKCAYVKDYIYKQIPYNLNLGKDVLVYEGLKMQDLYKIFLEKYSLNSMCCQLIKADVIKSNKLTVNTKYVYGEDARFNYELYSHVNKVVLVDKAYYHYYYNDNSATTIKKEENIKRRIKEAVLLYDSLYDYLERWNINDEKNRQKVAARVIIEFVYRSRELFVLCGQGYSKKQILKLVNDVYNSKLLQKSLDINKEHLKNSDKEVNLYLKCVLSGNIKMYTSFGIIIYKVKRMLKTFIKKSPRG